MGWVWKNDDTDYITSSSRDGKGDRCATRKVVSSQCRTEEVEPGNFIRKCEKTEQIFKDCVGSDIEAIERSLFGGMGRFFEAAEDMKNEFFRSVGTPNILDKEGSSSRGRGVHVEGAPRQEALPKNSSRDGDVDLSGLAKDV
ncbi:hypothetical protein PHJA_001134900 [Phtheirospermum japonicum]|uniref:Uncharacterized protein n=1 Tax=Phtheirospermum japonicum TaxID=374723 RepID=A0A830C6N9_9LAMI|nr:hypothetical protein PHJA_001134900 [Phtheirospermum japonicum]